MNPSDINALTQEIQWLQQVIFTSFKLYFKNPCEYQSLEDLVPPSHNDGSYLAEVIEKYSLDFEETHSTSACNSPGL